MSSDLQRDIDEISRFVSQCGWQSEREAWQRLKPRLTPDRERVFAAITETLIRFGHDDATMLQDCIFAADAAIAAMGETP